MYVYIYIYTHTHTQSQVLVLRDQLQVLRSKTADQDKASQDSLLQLISSDKKHKAAALAGTSEAAQLRAAQLRSLASCV